jgi:hypothetical protein
VFDIGLSIVYFTIDMHIPSITKAFDDYGVGGIFYTGDMVLI